jgi:glycosyltransferase involved in cell wall biosynthesis
MISIVLPFYNEEANVDLLFNDIILSLDGFEYEIIAVNDGSKDNTLANLEKIKSKNSNFKIVNFKRNFGQTAAIQAGIDEASGDIIVLMDTDLENFASDIPNLVLKMSEGYDVVSGWRKERWGGQYLTRKLPSMMANRLISKISGVSLHDYGCTLKAYKSEIIKDVRLYGQMHRFIPVFCYWEGAIITEIPVNYRPRIHGKSNYGFSRTFKVILDLILIKFLQKYQRRPIHFFGAAGFVSFFLSFISFALAFYFKISGQKDFVQTPLPIFAAMFFIVGILMILLGVVSEIVMRTYYESQEKRIYKKNY